MPVALDLFSNFEWVRSSGYLSERLGNKTTVSGQFVVSRTGIVSTLLLAFPTFFLRKKSAKSQEQYAKQIYPKEGGTTANFQIPIFALFFTFRYVGITTCIILRVQEAGSKPLGGLLEAQRSTCGSLLGPLEGLMGSWRAS